MKGSRAPAPVSFKFVTQNGKNTTTFFVLEKDIDRYTRFFVVVPERIGCVTLSFDPNPRHKDPVVTVQSIKHDKRCAEEGLPRKYGTRAMILGTLNVLKDIAHHRYPHLRTIELNDEASYPCPPFAVQEDNKIKTFATDLLLRNETYYERHLNVRPCREPIKQIVTATKSRVNRAIDVSFEAFWKNIGGSSHAQQDAGSPTDVHRAPEQIKWLHDNAPMIQQLFTEYYNRRQSWKVFFQRLHQEYGCTFFACSWWRLCVLFNMTRLVGAAWSVSFDRLPSQSYTILQQQEHQHNRSQGGGHSDGKKKRAQKEIQNVITRNLRGRLNSS